ncbi:hypothetical protein [Acetobacter nitrogenifigens]|nr:hypothetical protein [Acetobacter nitrogenifigens]
MQKAHVSEAEKSLMADIGIEYAENIKKKSLPLDAAASELADRISSFISISVTEGGLSMADAKACAAAALEAGVSVLAREIVK